MPGIYRTYTSHVATGNAEKLIVEVREDDGSITSYKVQAQQLSGKTEEQINTALASWMTANGYSEFVGTIGVHVNRDESFTIWTGSPPPVWPEDEV